MSKLFQINTCINHSTGNITQQIGETAIANGWESWIAYSARSTEVPSKSHLIKIGSKFDTYWHAMATRLFDIHGMSSTAATRSLVRKIAEIDPDIVQLHIVHGYYLDIRVLFQYLNSRKKPFVWTFHDCWSMTGHCAHFDSIKCMKWKAGCHDCEIKREYPASKLFDRSKQNYYFKKYIFSKCDNLTIVPVSDWLNGVVKESFLNKIPTRVIKNGIDLSVFEYSKSSLREKLGIGDRFVILGVATGWYEGAGLKRLKEFLKLSQFLDDDYVIILIGLESYQTKSLPANVIGLQRTVNQKELAEYYSIADVFINPTYQDSLPTVNMESQACGTPVITYRTGGSPELLTPDTGWIVDRGDIEAIVGIIKKYSLTSEEERKFKSTCCINNAIANFNKDDRFKEYIDLYNSLI